MRNMGIGILAMLLATACGASDSLPADARPCGASEPMSESEAKTRAEAAYEAACGEKLEVPDALCCAAGVYECEAKAQHAKVDPSVCGEAKAACLGVCEGW